MKVMVIAAHPDDEVLGCGGTLARHAEAGDAVRVVFLTDGVGARGDAHAEEVAHRQDAARAALAILGLGEPLFGDFPDNALDTVPLLRITQRVEAASQGWPPDIVYTHHGGDLNVDHRLAHQAVLTAFRPQPGRARPTILGFETASSTEWQAPHAGQAFLPNWFMDIGAVLPRKLDALRSYAREMRDWPHARSVEALEHLARWRGASVGCEAAEAFVLLRRVA